MAEKLVTTKITPAALRSARLIAAKTGERLYEAVQRVLDAECVRLGLANAEQEQEP